jgi:hypothetical protein
VTEARRVSARSSSVDLLADALTREITEEADRIDDLLDAVADQKECVKAGDQSATQELMKEIQEISFLVQTREAQRARAAKALAEALGCGATLSSLSAALPEGKRALFAGAGDRLRHSVFALKAEMRILSGLIEQNERFSAMLLSEWRRLDQGFRRPGGLDFRG